MSSEKKNYKEAKKLAKKLETPKKVVNYGADALDTVDKARGITRRILQLASSNPNKLSEVLPASVNTALTAVGVGAALAGIPLAVWDLIQRIMKRSDTEKKIKKKAKPRQLLQIPQVPTNNLGPNSVVLKKYESDEFNIHDLEAADALGYKGAAIALSILRTGIIIAGGVIAVLMVIEKLPELLGLANMGLIIGVAGMVVKILIAAFSYKKTHDKLTNVREAEASYQVDFDNKYRNFHQVDFKSLICFLRNEEAHHKMTFSLFWERVSSYTYTSDEVFWNQQIKTIFERNLPRDKQGILEIDLDMLAKALKGEELEAKYKTYKNIVDALKRTFQSQNAVDVELSEFFANLAQFCKKTATLSMPFALRNLTLDKEGKVTAQQFRDYLDSRDTYRTFKKKLIDKGIKRPQEAVGLIDYNKNKTQEENRLVEHSNQLLDKVNGNTDLEDRVKALLRITNSEKIQAIFVSETKCLSQLKRLLKGMQAGGEFEGKEDFQSILTAQIELLTKKQIFDKKYPELSKKLKKEKLAEADLIKFDQFSKEYHELKSPIIRDMNDNTRKTLINSVFGREAKLEGKRFGKGITLTIAIIGLIVGAIISIVFPPSVGLWAMTIIPALILVWELVDRFADFPWKVKPLTREAPITVSDTYLMNYLNAHDHRKTVNTLVEVTSPNKFSKKLAEKREVLQREREIHGTVKDCNEDEYIDVYCKH